MPNFGAFSTPIFPPWATLVGEGDEVQGQVGGPTEIRTEAGIYLHRDVGKLSAQYNGALAKVVLEGTPGAANTWVTDGWSPGDAEAGYEIRALAVTCADTTNLGRWSVTLVDTLDSDLPVGVLAYGTVANMVQVRAAAFMWGAQGGASMTVLPLFFRQQSTRWAVRLDVASGAGGAMAAPVRCALLYAESLKGIEMDRG